MLRSLGAHMDELQQGLDVGTAAAAAPSLATRIGAGRRAATLISVCVTYFLASKLGLSLAFIHANASAVWPSTGLAIAVMLVFGRGLWPAIFVGAFAVNITTKGSIATSLGIALGNTLEAVVAATLVERFANGRRAFDRPANLFRFAVFAALVSTVISPTFGLTSLALGGFAQWSDYPAVWTTWWLGDVAGALIVTPFLLLWIDDTPRDWKRWKVAEALLLLITVTFVAGIVFGGLWPTTAERYPLEFLCIPPLLWAGFRFGPRETATCGALLCAFAVRATLMGSGPFVESTPNESMVLLQSYMAVTILMSLAVAASVRNRQAAEARVQDLNAELERTVEHRTAQLRASNAELSTEVAERRRALSELERSQTRLIEAQHLARIGSFEWDKVADRVWWSDELFRIYDLDPAQFSADYRGYAERLHPDDRVRIEAILHEALESPRPFAFEHRILLPDGRERTVQATGEVLVDEHGRARGMRGTTQDITERKRVEREREQLVGEQSARREAEEANRAKDEFLAVLSHELRTPLNAIVGWAELMRGGGLDEATTRSAIETIARNAQAQTKIIADILEVSRIVSGKVELDMQHVQLHALVAGVVDGAQPSAHARNILLTVDAQPAAVEGDPVRLQQVVGNLLTNALKFAPRDNGRVNVTVRVHGDTATIVVEDNGPGIRPDFLPHVFDRFRQADASTTRHHGGLGIGLAIVRHLVELHGGTVAAGNRVEGSGAILSVSLPLASARTESHAVRALPVERPSLEGVRVLVVDDEADARAVARKMLEFWGASVDEAASVAAALIALQQGVPTLVLTDIGMPGEDGYELLLRVRALPADRGGRLPIAAVTAYASAEDRRRLLQAGFALHLTKPIEAAELARAVMTLAQITS